MTLYGQEMNIWYGKVPESFAYILDSNIDGKIAMALSKYGYKAVAAFLSKGGLGKEIHTHNAVLINFLDDDFALNNIVYVADGIVKRLSEFEGIEKELQYLGPGEALCGKDEFIMDVEFGEEICSELQELFCQK